MERQLFWFGAWFLVASLLQPLGLFICSSDRKSKHKHLFKFTWNLPFKVSETQEICLFGSFCNSINFATFCHILQRYCNFCSNISSFCNVIATFAAIFLIFATLLQLLQRYFLFLATFLHCNYWQNALSSPILFIAFIMQSFSMQFITWF